MSHPEPRACPYCSSQGPRECLHRQVFQDGLLGASYDVVVCESCGGAFADGIPSQDALDRFYSERSKYVRSEQGDVDSDSSYDTRRFEIISRQIQPYIQCANTTVLDIGCATGGFLKVLRDAGVERVWGVDPSPAAGRAAEQQHGIVVRTGTLFDLPREGVADFITLIGVLEHVRDVEHALAAVLDRLAPDGLVYCAQPDVEAFADTVNAPYQQFSMEHVNFFSSRSLRYGLERAGFRFVAGWRWMVEWRAGIHDSVVSGVFARGSAELPPMCDDVSRPALLRYLQKCQHEEKIMSEFVGRICSSVEPVIIWGAGTLARRLLASTPLSRASILAFVDGNSHLQGVTLGGIPVRSPSWAETTSAPIFVCSLTFQHEIVSEIKNLRKLSNPVFCILPCTDGS